MATPCLECKGRDSVVRGLCKACYGRLERLGVLDMYPTKDYIQNPSAAIRWALEEELELVRDIAIEFGLVIASDD